MDETVSVVAQSEAILLPKRCVLRRLFQLRSLCICSKRVQVAFCSRPWKNPTTASSRSFPMSPPIRWLLLWSCFLSGLATVAQTKIYQHQTSLLVDQQVSRVWIKEKNRCLEAERDILLPRLVSNAWLPRAGLCQLHAVDELRRKHFTGRVFPVHAGDMNFFRSNSGMSSLRYVPGSSFMNNPVQTRGYKKC